jgi:hypothetical protein
MASLAADLLSFPPEQDLPDNQYDEAIINYLKLLGQVRASELVPGVETENDLLEVGYIPEKPARIRTNDE